MNRYIHPLNREKMFASSGVHCRSNATEVDELICYECKLNNDQDLSIHHFTIEEKIAHMEEHLTAGHKPSNLQLQRWKLEKEISDKTVQSVTIHYAISNNGDGSASVLFFKTPEEAEQFDANQDEGWGEPCNSTETLHFDADGVLINADTLKEN